MANAAILIAAPHLSANEIARVPELVQVAARFQCVPGKHRREAHACDAVVINHDVTFVGVTDVLIGASTGAPTAINVGSLGQRAKIHTHLIAPHRIQSQPVFHVTFADQRVHHVGVDPMVAGEEGVLRRVVAKRRLDELEFELVCADLVQYEIVKASSSRKFSSKMSPIA